MRVVIRETYEEMGRAAAEFVAERINGRPDGFVLGLATGSTPLALYRRLVEKCAAGKLSFRRVTTFNLDEYVGLTTGHARSYQAFMDEHLFNLVDIDPKNTHLPDGAAGDIAAAAAAYEGEIRRAGGIDLQVVGIGGNGHIGFNEPGSTLASRTRVVALAERTIRDNARFFNNASEVPCLALTMGAGTIREAREIALLAAGPDKAEIVARAIEGPVTCRVPASLVQLHPEVAVFLDREAAARLEGIDYYRHAEGLPG